MRDLTSLPRAYHSINNAVPGSSAMMIEVNLVGVFETAVTTAVFVHPDGSVIPSGFTVATSEREDLLEDK